MDHDVDSARFDLKAIRLGFKTDKEYANEIWRRRLEEQPKVKKSRWKWPVRRLVDEELERRDEKERKNVIKFERFVEKIANKQLKKLAKKR